MEETSPADSSDIYIDALKALISPGVYAAPLEDSPLMDLPTVVDRFGLESSPGTRARVFIDALERVVAEQLKMNDRKAAEILFALGDWTGKPAQERRVAVAKLRDKHWTWEKNYRKEPLYLDLRKVYLALIRDDVGPSVAVHAPRQPVPEAVRPAEKPHHRHVDSVLRRSCAWVQRVQNRDGGLPSDNEGSISCTWSTAGLLWAMAEAGEDAAALWKQRALSWVLDHGNQDRGIPIVGKGDPSITDATAQALLATRACYEATGDGFYRDKVTDLANWLILHQEPGSGWAWRPGMETSWTASTCFGLLALDAALPLFPAQRENIEESIRVAQQWLLTTQNNDCGWGSHRGDHSRAAITGIVLFTLSRLASDARADSVGLIGGAIDFIKDSQRSDGTWASTIDRPMGHTITRFGDAYCLLGIAAASTANHDPFLREGVQALMKSHQGSYFQYEDTVMHSWPTRDGILALSAASRKLQQEKGSDGDESGEAWSYAGN
ncbi:prenyltransferase/squalene oxidase repeat-containing protein [Streptomyces sp. MMBL 11-3]|uniref:prenyltransferase/squalene oxidase repeat-containing protein n=1 Tax=Streptomyces sp. MMBL 11-3 TaxID=3382639 RepID=UPI0039B63EA5